VPAILFAIGYERGRGKGMHRTEYESAEVWRKLLRALEKKSVYRRIAALLMGRDGGILVSGFMKQGDNWVPASVTEYSTGPAGSRRCGMSGTLFVRDIEDEPSRSCRGPLRGSNYLRCGYQSSERPYRLALRDRG
jgi:hypothetical protein